MAGNFFDPRPQYRLDSGAVCAGGTLYFYEANSTTPQDVYSDSDLGTSIGATVELDSAGRTPTDVFLADAEYNVELRDADDTQVWLAENVNAQGAAAATMPDPSTGDEDDVLSTDGVDALWRAIREVPDPASQTGKYLGTDGEVIQWTAFPEATTYDEDNLPGGIVETTAGENFVIGNTRFMSGSGTIPTAASAITSTVAVSFPASSFASPPRVVCTATSSGVTNNSPADDASVSAVSKSASGFTARAFCGAENNAGTISITGTIAFDWMAMGPKA